MKEIVESVLNYAKSKGIEKGWICADGNGFFLKAADHEAAVMSKCRYVFFVKDGDATIYQG